MDDFITKQTARQRSSERGLPGNGRLVVVILLGETTERLRGEQEIGSLEQAQRRLTRRPARWGTPGEASLQLKEKGGDAGLQDGLLPGRQHADQGICRRGALAGAAKVTPQRPPGEQREAPAVVVDERPQNAGQHEAASQEGQLIQTAKERQPGNRLVLEDRYEGDTEKNGQ